jgi:hypothetical protein
MSELRDARLQRALESAPDAHQLPRPGTRVAISHAARKALASADAPAASWWRRLWLDSGQPRMPWNAAFASVLLASLVTLLWREQESAVPVDAPSAAPAPALPAPSPPTDAVPAPTRDTRKAPAAQPREARHAPAATTASRGRSEESAGALSDAERAPLAKSAPLPRTEALRRGEAADGQASGKNSLAAPARVSVAPSAPAASLAQKSVAAEPTPVPTGLPEWALVRIEIDGHSLELPRERAQRLAQLLNSIAVVPPRPETLEGAVTARLEMLRDGGTVAVLELAQPQVRWVLGPYPGAGRGLTSWPDPTDLQALREELMRLVQGR